MSPSVEQQVDLILARLRSAGTETQKMRATKRGVPEEQVLGVSKSLVQREAKQLGANQQLAAALWQSGYHEARLLAILVAEPKNMSQSLCQDWINELWSWDIVDSFARYLLLARSDRFTVIASCVTSESLYRKRLGFAVIACCVMKDPEFAAENSESFFEMIRRAADDQRHHVRKAVVWALVEMGKVSSALQEEALIVANELIEESGNAVWLGRNARKELELLTEVKERRRLVTAKSKTARKPRTE